MTLDHVSRLLEAYAKLEQSCRLLDHGNPPTVLRHHLMEISRIRGETVTE